MVLPEEEVDIVTDRLEKRLVGDMVSTYPRRVKNSDKIEAWLADEIRDAIALIRRQALKIRGLDEDRAKLLQQLKDAEQRLSNLQKPSRR